MQTGVQQKAEVSQGLQRRFFSTGWNGVAAGWQGGLERPQGEARATITSRTAPGAGRGHRGQVQEAEPTAEGADFTRGARSIRSRLGADRPSSALPGVARPGALHPRAVLLRQDTHRANFKRERIRPTTNGHMGQ